MILCHSSTIRNTAVKTEFGYAERIIQVHSTVICQGPYKRYVTLQGVGGSKV